MRLKSQIWLFKQSDSSFQYLLFKRPPGWHGGEFWQPITGNVERGEEPCNCAVREVQEETCIEDLGELINPNLVCSFAKADTHFDEHIFAVETTGMGLQLSSEHEAFAWLDYKQALSRLQFDTNIVGLGAIHALLTRQNNE